ncbi:hypothetical protein K491DRAFT_301372 [Lophiostoma macrostomum CBS 122681]|uniref:Uncharacterized protein n=1 Tax=Lophiostoma macrostomum CBS 122681 TaxID=1314788 RepID=A0A6A6TEW8_9PLEO|nr:hypothetical protein K491DRAFT_301372 [Lophiostoma macrostomum CBS 122681]
MLCCTDERTTNHGPASCWAYLVLSTHTAARRLTTTLRIVRASERNAGRLHLAGPRQRGVRSYVCLTPRFQGCDHKTIALRSSHNHQSSARSRHYQQVNYNCGSRCTIGQTCDHAEESSASDKCRPLPRIIQTTSPNVNLMMTDASPRSSPWQNCFKACSRDRTHFTHQQKLTIADGRLQGGLPHLAIRSTSIHGTLPIVVQNAWAPVDAQMAGCFCTMQLAPFRESHQTLVKRLNMPEAPYGTIASFALYRPGKAQFKRMTRSLVVECVPLAHRWACARLKGPLQPHRYAITCVTRICTPCQSATMHPVQ